MKTKPRTFACLVVATLLAATAACSKEEMSKALEDAKAKTQQVAEQATEKVTEQATSAAKVVKEQLPATGQVALEMTPAVQPTSKATVEIITFPDGRPSVVQILTYDPANATSGSYPKVLLQGTTDAAALSSLGGGKVSCDLYVTIDAAGQMAMTQGETQVMVTFRTFDSKANTIEASLSSAQMVNTKGEVVNLRGGRLLAKAK